MSRRTRTRTRRALLNNKDTSKNKNKNKNNILFPLFDEYGISRVTQKKIVYGRKP
jgi:hypothetical protein